MIRRIATLAIPVLVAALAPGSAAQAPGSKLAALHDTYQQDRMRLAKEGASFGAIQKLTEDFADRLEKFLGGASGVDRFNGRLMLVDYRLSLGQRDRAVEALQALDARQAPALILVGAAEFAGHLGMDSERRAWIDAAIAKKESFENRAALATHLMTRLLEVNKGELIFEQALAEARTDEDRAKVMWYRGVALREREDLEEDSYEGALTALAEEYPDTYYGGIARDRLLARTLEVGSSAIDFEVADAAGNRVRLADYAGKVLLIEFWASWSGPSRSAAPHLAAMRKEYGERGLEILGVSMDANRADFDHALRELDITWPQVWDGKGDKTELALRYFVDGPPRTLLIGRDGKIAGLYLYPVDKGGVTETRSAIEAALDAEQ